MEVIYKRSVQDVCWMIFYSVYREWYKTRQIPSKDFLNLHHITHESMVFRPCVHPPKNTALVKHFAHLILYLLWCLGEGGHFWTQSIFLNGMVSGSKMKIKCAKILTSTVIGFSWLFTDNIWIIFYDFTIIYHYQLVNQPRLQVEILVNQEFNRSKP